MKDTKKTVLVTGVLGQDGSYLVELLLQKGYRVYGIDRESLDRPYAKNIESQCILHYGDITDEYFLARVFENALYDEVYNFAAISDLGTAKKFPEETLKINHHAVGLLFQKAVEVNHQVRLFQASSSQMFDVSAFPQNEDTVFLAKNIYAEAKIAAHKDFVIGLREKGVFACSGFLFNHESPRREERFVTGKIVRTLAKIKLGLIDTPLEIGNMDMERDWSFAGDIVSGAHMMLQAETPHDYVLASGVLHTVRDFVEYSAKNLGISLSWKGEGVDESGVGENGTVIVRINKDFYASKEVLKTVGDISRIKKDLGWEPKVSFEELVKMMVESALLEFKTKN